MTKNEFIQQACISMASKVVNPTGTVFHRSCLESVVKIAEDMADILEEREHGFDLESDADRIAERIVGSLRDIEEEMERQYDNEHLEYR